MKKQILLVDDENLIREMLTDAFTKQGYKVWSAAGGKEALKILKHQSVNVMFLDLNMPEMNGIELCRQIRRDKPMAIIYALTGFASLFELSDCREAGFDDYFTKPAKLDDLFNAAAEAFEKIGRWKKQ